jgi:hypothetical protein
VSHPNTIKVKPWSAEQGDHVVINEDDFDSEVHELFRSKKQVTRAEFDGMDQAEKHAAIVAGTVIIDETEAPKRGRPKKESAPAE